MYHEYDSNRITQEQESLIHASAPQTPKAALAPQKPKRKLTGRLVALCLCCVLAGAAAGSGGVWAAGRLSKNSTTLYDGTRPTVVSLANVDGETVLTAEEVYAANVESVVGISGNVTTNVWGQTVSNAVSGSGFVITSDGYILTNYHVVNGVSDIKVSFSDGSSYDAVLVGGEEENDIAVLKIEATGLRPVVLGDSSAIQVGESVYAIGNPLGELTFTFTGGYVSAKDRSITMSDGTIMNMIQTDTAINSGNSGGPLFDKYGQVVGIVTAKYSNSGSNSTVEGLGFAIPMNDVKDMITSIMEKGYVAGRPNLGILMENVDAVLQQYGLPAGVRVLSVLQDSCAEKAKLQSGDIITAINDTSVASSAQLKAEVQKCKAGDSVTLSVYRSGQTQSVRITFDEDTAERQAAMQKLQSDYQASQQMDTGYQTQFPYGTW